MIPVDQTILAGITDGVRGDCFRACIASVLEMPINNVPHFCQSESWLLDCDNWLKERGLGLVMIQHGADFNFYAEVPYLVSGKSPRGDWLHSVVYQGGKMVHDPHPSRAGIVGEPKDYILILAVEPERFAEGLMFSKTEVHP